MTENEIDRLAQKALADLDKLTPTQIFHALKDAHEVGVVAKVMERVLHALGRTVRVAVVH